MRIYLLCAVFAARAVGYSMPRRLLRSQRTRMDATAAADPLPDYELCEVLADDPKFRQQRETLGCQVISGGLRDPDGPRGRLLKEAEGARMGRDVSRRPTVLAHIEALEALNPTPEPLASPNLSGRWRLVYTTSDSILGTARIRLFKPRPRILQHLNTETLTAYNEEWVLGGLLRNSVRAKLTPQTDGATVDVQFKRFGIGWLKIPAPKSAKGVLTTTYLDEELRISRGDKGNLFVLVRDGISKV